MHFKKNNQSERFKQELNYLLETIIILLDNINNKKGDNLQLKIYIDLWINYLKSNLLKDKKYFNFYLLTDKIRNARSDKYLHALIREYPECHIKGIELNINKLTASYNKTNQKLINLVKQEYKKNINYYKNEYLAQAKDPKFKVREIFIKKGYINGKYVSDKTALNKIKHIQSLLKKDKTNFIYLSKKHSNNSHKPRELIEYGEIYDKLINIARGGFSNICKHKNGYSIFKLINKKTNKPDFKSDGYFNHTIGSALKSVYSKMLNKILKDKNNNNHIIRKLKKYYKISNIKTTLHNNPIFTSISPPKNKLDGALLSPFCLTDQKHRKYYYESDPKILLFFNEPAKVSFVNKKRANKHLYDYIINSKEDRLFSFWFWAMRFKTSLNLRRDLHFLNELRKKNISVSSFYSVYNKLSSIVKTKINSIKNHFYRERLNVYYELLLDLLSNYLSLIYKDKIKHFMSNPSKRSFKVKINLYKRLFSKIFSDACNIQPSFNKPKIDKNMKNIYMIDTHDKAYPILKNLNKNNITLLHFDAHKDLWMLPLVAHNKSKKTSLGEIRINEGNYLRAVMREGLIKKLILIYPDSGEEINTDNPEILKEHFIWEQFYFFPSLLKQRKRYSLFIEGKEILVCDLKNIPKLKGDVILDIDLDYFICNPLGIRKPWIKFKDFVNTISKKKLRIKSIILSYSIKDGYVCPNFRDLGNNLARHLKEMA